MVRDFPRNRTTAEAVATDNVRVVAFDVDRLRYAIPEWDALPRAARLAHLRDTPVAPRQTSTASNATTTGLHETIAAALTLAPTQGDDIDELDTLLLGDDDSSFSDTDTSLNNKIGDIQITDRSATGATFEINEFLSSNQLNGETIAELGIQTASGRLCNHAPTTADYAKDQTIAILFNVEITFSDS